MKSGAVRRRTGAAQGYFVLDVTEHREKQLAAVTGLLVVTLTIVAVLVQGNVARRDATAQRTVGDAVLARGQLVYEQAGCSRCHSIAGVGSRRVPLDGVGTRRAPEQIEAWIRADAEVAGAMPRSVVEAKAEYRKLSEADCDALARWLAETTRLDAAPDG